MKLYEKISPLKRSQKSMNFSDKREEAEAKERQKRKSKSKSKSVTESFGNKHEGTSASKIAAKSWSQ